MPASDDDVSLREYLEEKFAAVEARFESVDARFMAALSNQERALQKAEAASEKRFDAVNEFRAALADNFRTLMPRAESEQARAIIHEKIDMLTIRINKREDRGIGMGQFAAWIIAAVGFISAISTIVIMLTRAP
jgi:hypothetical protein